MGREFSIRTNFSFDALATHVRLILDDGLHNQGYRIKDFKILPNLFHGQTVFAGAVGMLSTNPLGVAWDLEKPEQLAWTTFDDHGYAHWEDVQSLTDPTVVFNRDLYLHVWNARQSDSATYHMSVYVLLEEVELTDNQAVLILANESTS